MSWTIEERRRYFENYKNLYKPLIETKARKRERERKEYEDKCNKAHRETMFKDEKDEML